MKKLFFLSLIALTSFSCSKDKDCDPGFTGPDCDQEIIPKSMELLSITVLLFPIQDRNGLPWDVLDDPDLYINISYQGNLLYTSYSNPISKAQGPITWSFFSNPLIIDRPNEFYTISLYDRDDIGNNELIETVNFRPYRAGLNFPIEVFDNCNNCLTKWKYNCFYNH